MSVIDLEPQYFDSNKYNYDVPKDEIEYLIAKLLEERPPTGSEPEVCYRFDAINPEDEKYTNVARTIERTIFERHFNNTTPVMHREYGPFEEQSRFYLKVDVDKNSAEDPGMLRVIQNGRNGLKTLKDLGKQFGDDEYQQHIFEHYGITDPSECWDIGTVAGGRPGNSILLYRAMYVDSQQEGIKHFFSMVDEKPFETMQKLGFPFEPLTGTTWMPYAGSKKSLPVYGDAPTFEASVREQEKAIRDNPVMQRIIGNALAQLGRGTKDDALQF